MYQESPALVSLLVGFVVGIAIASFAAWLILRRRIQSALRQVSEAQIEIIGLGQRVNDLDKMASDLPQCQASLRQEATSKGAFEALADERSLELERLRDELRQANTRVQESAGEQLELRVQVAELTQKLESEKSQSADKADLINNAEKKFSDTFDALANRILDAKSAKFTEQNQQNLRNL